MLVIPPSQYYRSQRARYPPHHSAPLRGNEASAEDLSCQLHSIPINYTSLSSKVKQ